MIRGLLFTLAVALVGCGKDPFASAAADLPAAKARAVKAGLALSAGELVRNVPVAENAAKEYNEAIRVSKDLKAEAKVIRDAAPLFRNGRRATDAELAETRRALAKFRPVFALIEAAARKPQCDFERDYSQGSALLFPELASMKEYARAVGTAMTVAAHDGDVSGVKRHVKSLATLVRHSGEEPNLIGSLVTIAMSSISLRAVEDAATQAQGNPRVLQALLAGMSGIPPTFSFKNALRSESVMYMISVRKIAADSAYLDKLLPSEGINPPEHVRAAVARAKNVDKKVLGDALAARALTSVSELAEDQESAKSTTELVAAWKKREDSLASAKDPATSIFALIGPVMGQAIVAVRRHEYRYAAVQAGLSLLAQRTGPLPRSGSTLPANVQAVIKAGGLKYSVLGAGFVIEPKQLEIDTGSESSRRSVAFVFPSKPLGTR